ncbi:MAG TPA: hypothetical protein VIX84_05530, partial [Acidimicrobiales bacterium]
MHNGRPGPFEVGNGTGSGSGGHTGLSFGGAAEWATAADMLGSVQDGGDALVRLNDAFLPDAVFVD